MDFTLGTSSFITVKGGYFYDSYKDTGVPDNASYTYQTSAVGLPFAIPASLVGGVNTVNTPRVQVRLTTSRSGASSTSITRTP